METCTEIQARRNDYLNAGYDNFPELITLFIRYGFDPIFLNEVYCIDEFEACS